MLFKLCDHYYVVVNYSIFLFYFILLTDWRWTGFTCCPSGIPTRLKNAFYYIGVAGAFTSKTL